MKIRIKSVKSKIIVFFIGLAAFQICVMAGFAKLQLEPSIVSMYSEHLERFADVALTETTQETEKIERYMVNIIGDAQIQDFLRRADEEQSAELPPVLSTELRNRILSYTDYDNIITAIYLVDNYGRIYSNLGKSPMQTFMNRNQELKDRKEESAVWYGGENGNTITVYRNVNNNTTDLTQKIGALCIFIDRKMFQERIDDLMMEEEQHYVLENEERHLKISSDQDETEERDSIVVMRTDGRWGLRTWIEKDIIYRPVKMMMRILLAELFALLLVSIALVVFLSERITRPIRKLTIAMKEIGAGNIDTVVLDEGEDELGLLAATLNRMSKSIKKLMEQIFTLLGLRDVSSTANARSAVSAKGVAATLRELGAVLRTLLGRVFWLLHRGTFRRFSLHIAVGAGDPADAALDYGMVCAALYPVLGLLQSAIRFRRPDVAVTCTEEPQTNVEFSAKFSLRAILIVRAFFHLLAENVRNTL